MSLISGRRSPDSQACLFLPRPEMFQHSSLKMSREPLPPPLRILLFDRSAVRLRYPNHRHMRYRHSLARRPFTFRLISILFGASADTPSASFYRLYEFFVIDWTVQFRNELEYFGRMRSQLGRSPRYLSQRQIHLKTLPTRQSAILSWLVSAVSWSKRITDSYCWVYRVMHQR